MSCKIPASCDLLFFFYYYNTLTTPFKLNASYAHSYTQTDLGQISGFSETRRRTDWWGVRGFHACAECCGVLGTWLWPPTASSPQDRTGTGYNSGPTGRQNQQLKADMENFLPKTFCLRHKKKKSKTTEEEALFKIRTGGKVLFLSLIDST